MEKPTLSSPSNYAPMMEKFGYNQVLQVGNRIDISGQGGWDKDMNFTYKSLEEEIDQAFQNVEYVLNSVGSSWKDVYSVKSYHIPLGDEVVELFPKMFKKYLGDRKPIWSCVGVSQLGEKEMHVEIVVTAIKE